MKTFSIAARRPGFIVVKARSQEKALRLAEQGEGCWVDDDSAGIELLQPPSSVAILTEEQWVDIGRLRVALRPLALAARSSASS